MTSTDDPYLWKLFPRPGRFPRLFRHWGRLSSVVVLVTGAAAVGPWVSARITCRDGLLPTAQVWSQHGDCVGISDGSYAFGLSDMEHVFDVIHQQNTQPGPCGPMAARPVTVGVLVTSNSANAGGRGRHELEGMAAAQAAANRPGCARPILLRVAQMGAEESAAARVANTLADEPDLVAVVGLGLSDQRSAEAAAVLARRGIPMVADLITAEGFDQGGSAGDRPDFGRCEAHEGYSGGIGRGYFYRVAYRNDVQVARLAEVLWPDRAGRRVDFVVTPTDQADPSPCTALPLIHRRFGAGVHDVRFDPGDASTVVESVKQLCDRAGDVTVVYAARAADLARFVIAIDEQYAMGWCASTTSITVASISDGSRLRAVEPDPVLEAQRLAALTSKAYADGTLRLLYTPLAAPELSIARGGGFGAFRARFTGLGFAADDLDDGWAMSAHDSLMTVAGAVNAIAKSTGAVSPGQVNVAIGAFSSAGHPVPGAVQGPLYFDNDGNRVGRAQAVRLCAATGRPARSVAVPVRVRQDGVRPPWSAPCPEDRARP